MGGTARASPRNGASHSVPDGYIQANSAAATGLRKALGRLRELVDRRSGRPLSDAELVELPRLYRLACSVLARLESRGARPRATHEVRRLVDGSLRRDVWETRGLQDHLHQRLAGGVRLSAYELADDIHNGNRKDARSKLHNLPAPLAAAVAGYFIDLTGGPSAVGERLRFLSDGLD